MTLALEPVADNTAPLARRNPVAKLGAALLFSLPLIATLDPLTPAIGLAVELALLPLFGVHPEYVPRVSESRSGDSPPWSRAPSSRPSAVSRRA